nr:hypothetical protein CparaKRNrm2_p118 [Cryptomonas paramecium]
MVDDRTTTHYTKYNNITIVNIKIKILKKVLFFFFLGKSFFIQTIFFKFYKLLFYLDLYIYLVYNSISNKYNKSILFFTKIEKKKCFDYIMEKIIENIFLFSKRKYKSRKKIRVKNKKHLDKSKANNFFEYFLTNFYKNHTSKKIFWKKYVSAISKKNKNNLYILKTKTIYIFYANVLLKILSLLQRVYAHLFAKKKCFILVRTFGKINQNIIFLNYKFFSNFEKIFFLSEIFKKTSIYAFFFSYIYLTKINENK